MPRHLRPRFLLALLAASGLAGEATAKVAHGMAHSDEARLEVAMGASAHHASEKRPGIERNEKDADHASLHATTVAQSVAPVLSSIRDAAALPTARVVAGLKRSPTFDERARPPGGPLPPTRPRAPPTS